MGIYKAHTVAFETARSRVEEASLIRRALPGSVARERLPSISRRALSPKSPGPSARLSLSKFAGRRYRRPPRKHKTFNPSPRSYGPSLTVALSARGATGSEDGLARLFLSGRAGDQPRKIRNPPLRTAAESVYLNPLARHRSRIPRASSRMLPEFFRIPSASPYHDSRRPAASRGYCPAGKRLAVAGTRRCARLMLLAFCSELIRFFRFVSL